MYNFKEQQIGGDWCKEYINDVKKLIDASQTFTVVGPIGVGASMFLRYLATRDDLAYFIHIDLSEDSHLNTEGLIKFCRTEVEKALPENKRVVVILNRFNIKKREFDIEFLRSLRSIRDLDKEKVIFILTADKPLIEEKPDALMGGNLNMYSISYHLKPFSLADLYKLASINLNLATFDQKLIDNSLKQSGGHYQLFTLLLKTIHQADPLKDPIIKVQLKQLYNQYSYSDRKLLQKGKISCFSPLLKEYIDKELPIKLPVKEALLFKILRKKLGQVVSKDEIFGYVWVNNPEDATDWALNALIYRLRKNPSFIEKGYLIESFKKQGYCLQKN